MKKLQLKLPKISVGTNPRSDWSKLLIIFLAINILILIWNAYLFWRINKGDIFEGAPSQRQGVEETTRAKLSEVLTIYDAREKKFEELKLAKPVTVDPGI